MLCASAFAPSSATDFLASSAARAAFCDALPEGERRGEVAMTIAGAYRQRGGSDRDGARCEPPSVGAPSVGAPSVAAPSVVSAFRRTYSIDRACHEHHDQDGERGQR